MSKSDKKLAHNISKSDKKLAHNISQQELRNKAEVRKNIKNIKRRESSHSNKKKYKMKS